MKKKLTIIAVIVTSLVIAAWWLYEKSLWEELPDNPWISKIKNDGIRVRVTIPDESVLSKIVDMSVFNEFKTGNNFEKAIEIYGQPDNISDSKGITSLEYWRDNGRVEVVRQETSTGTTWNLYSYPNNKDYIDLLIPDIAHRVDYNNEESIVVIDTENDKLLMVIVIHGVRIDHLSWCY